jgi:hypothetical protein
MGVSKERAKEQNARTVNEDQGRRASSPRGAFHHSLPGRCKSLST